MPSTSIDPSSITWYNIQIKTLIEVNKPKMTHILAHSQNYN